MINEAMINAIESWGTLAGLRRAAAAEGRGWQNDYTTTARQRACDAKRALVAIARREGWPIVRLAGALHGVCTPAGWVVAHCLAEGIADATPEQLAEATTFQGMRVAVLRALAAGDYESCWEQARAAHERAERAARDEAAREQRRDQRELKKFQTRARIRAAYAAGVRTPAIRQACSGQWKNRGLLRQALADAAAAGF